MMPKLAEAIVLGCTTWFGGVALAALAARSAHPWLVSLAVVAACGALMGPLASFHVRNVDGGERAATLRRFACVFLAVHLALDPLFLASVTLWGMPPMPVHSYGAMTTALPWCYLAFLAVPLMRARRA